jgi:hypothetical protein
MELVTEYTEGAGEPERIDTSYEVAEVSALRVEKMSEPASTSENESSGWSSMLGKRVKVAKHGMWVGYKGRS